MCVSSGGPHLSRTPQGSGEKPLLTNRVTADGIGLISPPEQAFSDPFAPLNSSMNARRVLFDFDIEIVRVNQLLFFFISLESLNTADIVVSNAIDTFMLLFCIAY